MQSHTSDSKRGQLLRDLRRFDSAHDHDSYSH
nr:MAG TPA: hypothetical protein [Caudoviricetes sp.]